MMYYFPIFLCAFPETKPSRYSLGISTMKIQVGDTHYVRRLRGWKPCHWHWGESYSIRKKQVRLEDLLTKMQYIVESFPYRIFSQSLCRVSSFPHILIICTSYPLSYIHTATSFSNFNLSVSWDLYLLKVVLNANKFIK